MSYESFTSNALYMSRILRLQPEIGGMFVDHMDLFTLTKWRLTCKTNYHQCSAALRRSLLTLLRPFVPFPSALVDIIGKHHCLLGGEFALSFLLRDPVYKPADLEIYTGDFEFDAVCETILGDLNIRSQVRACERSTSTTFVALLRLIAQTLIIRLFNGKSIYIHQSYTTSPAAPLSRTPCTALSNFVTPYGFGCSHPSLTLHRRGLLADQQTPFLLDVDSSIMENLRVHQFSLAATPAAWPEYRRSFIPHDLDELSGPVTVESAVPDRDPSTASDLADVDHANATLHFGTPNGSFHVHAPDEGTSTQTGPTTSLAFPCIQGDSSVAYASTTRAFEVVDAAVATTEPDPEATMPEERFDDCWRHRYICPSQGRYFGDRGSFVDFFDPLGGDEGLCADSNIAPFGPMVVWRIMSTFECDEGCVFYDDVLEEGVTSIPVLFKKDPYGELRDIISDRYIGKHGSQRPWSIRRSQSM